MYQIDTIGMEFETCSRLPTEFYKDERIASYFRGTHDASIETPIVLLKHNLHMIDNGNLSPIFKNMERGIAGSELVSTPLTFDEMVKAVSYLTKRLSKFGARDEEERAGIHIHCAYPISYKILVDTIKLGLAFESLIFHLGGLGYQFRGLSNNSIFCRPFSAFGPPIVTSRGGQYIQLLDIEELLKASDMETFWKLFGGIAVRNPPSRYHPSRYFFINPFSALLHSTLEFRVFNTTLNIEYILACMRFCQEFTLMCVSGKNPFDFVSSVYNPSMSSQELLDNFCSHTRMEPEWRKILFKILEKTPFPEISKKYIFTHLRDYQTIEPIWKPKIFGPDDFEQSGFLDIHNIPTSSRGNIPTIRRNDEEQRIRIERAMENMRTERNARTERMERGINLTENIEIATPPIDMSRYFSPNPVFTSNATTTDFSGNSFQWTEPNPVNPIENPTIAPIIQEQINEVSEALEDVIEESDNDNDDDYDYTYEEDDDNTNPF